MGSQAEFAINNGLDPFIGSDWQPRSRDSSLYSTSKSNTNFRKAGRVSNKKERVFNDFREAWNFSKDVAPSSLKRDGNSFIVIFD